MRVSAERVDVTWDMVIKCVFILALFNTVKIDRLLIHVVWYGQLAVNLCLYFLLFEAWLLYDARKSASAGEITKSIMFLESAKGALSLSATLSVLTLLCDKWPLWTGLVVGILFAGFLLWGYILNRMNTNVAD